MTEEHEDNFSYEKEDGYESYSYEDAVGDPIRLVIEQHLTGQPIKWTGPERIHHSIAASVPPPSHYLSEEGIAYSEERGRDFWDNVIQVAFMLGWHQGTMRELEHSEMWKESYERMATLVERLQSKLPEPSEENKAEAARIVKEMWDAAASTDQES